MVLGAIAIVLAQRLEKKESKIVVYAITGLLIFLVGLSRIYVGVHYPTDVLAGFILAFGLLNAVYPTYDRIRFESDGVLYSSEIFDATGLLSS